MSPDTYRKTLVDVPDKVKPLLGKQGGFKQLSWDEGTLSFTGRMPFNLRNELWNPSNDRAYRRAIDDLYRFSNQLMGETVDTEWCERIGTKYPVGTQVQQGRVLKVVDFGAFVELEPGVQGLVHKSEMPSNLLEAGLEIDDIHVVRVIKVDCEKRQLGLSMMLEDPYSHYHMNDIKKGRIIRIVDFGAFVELELGVSGLVHKTKMWGTPSDPSRAVKVGEERDVQVISIDAEKHQIGLSMLLPQNDPITKYAAGSCAKGRVTEVKDYGAFVEIEPGVSGLIHKSKMSMGGVDPRTLIKKGDEVEVELLSVDRSSRKMAFALKSRY